MANWNHENMARNNWAGEVRNGSRDGGPDMMYYDDPAAMMERSGQGMGMTNGMGMTSGMGMGGALNMGPTPNLNASPNMGSTPSMPARLDMQNNLPDEVVEMPTNIQKAFVGTLKATLRRNKGNFIVATFLIGTQNTISWEGILYEVGNDYVTIYQPGRDRYVVCDMYSLKYMEFYDVRRREMCNRLLEERGYQQ